MATEKSTPGSGLTPDQEREIIMATALKAAEAMIERRLEHAQDEILVKSTQAARDTVREETRKFEDATGEIMRKAEKAGAEGAEKFIREHQTKAEIRAKTEDRLRIGFYLSGILAFTATALGAGFTGYRYVTRQDGGNGGGAGGGAGIGMEADADMGDQGGGGRGAAGGRAARR